jgi:hypothetical protein
MALYQPFDCIQQVRLVVGVFSIKHDVGVGYNEEKSLSVKVSLLEATEAT